MNFDPSFFQGEVREDFYVRSMMKRAWAAQLEVLHQIDIICKRHNIMYYAEWGTLLGAIRHKGFVPWDDDLDIGMLRKDYVRFLKYAKKELPKPYIVMDMEHGFDQLLTRIINGHEIRTDNEFMNTFHGCPYIVGIDIFPTDNIPINKSEEELQLSLLVLTNTLGHQWHNEELSEEEKLDTVQQIKETCNISFKEGTPIEKQLLILSDKICAMYWDTNANEVALMHMLAQYPDYRLPISCYSSTIDVPFENITIPVPVGYEQILVRRYGPNYMTPVKSWGTHDYPFFKSQEKMLFDHLTSKGIRIPDFLKE